MDSLRDVIQETVTAFVENNTAAVKNKDVSLLSSKLSSNCVKEYRPLSFVRKYPQFFKPQVTNAEYEAQMAMDLNTMTDVKQNVTRTVIDAHQRVANLWIEKTVYTVDGSTSSVEVIYDLELSPDGKEITKYIEFVDTYVSVQVLEQMLANAGRN
ncbi:hypothetical protein KVR01_013793 [Diaporthe batatas]|uniref:uncharacterized protein n=1 Tax=Diaporthe batatas TaxID=748121 RepID=UPI001D044AF3|nr:uncharacterized protein KVR01_013793 [Diaporthe batatas]KAG8156341.1 hypothetical protein KVR01_013793 [Diaporthe batatas]